MAATAADTCRKLVGSTTSPASSSIAELSPASSTQSTGAGSPSKSSAVLLALSTASGWPVPSLKPEPSASAQP